VLPEYQTPVVYAHFTLNFTLFTRLQELGAPATLGILDYPAPVMTPPRISKRLPEPGPLDATDPQSFAAHYREAYPRLTLVAAGVTGDRQSAEDIVQEAAIIAFEKADQFAPGTNFAAWLAEIVRRCALNHRRKTRQRKTYPADPAVLGQMNHHVATTEEPWPIVRRSGEVLDNQASFDDELLNALNQLSEDARSCLLLRTVENLSYAEIASLMHIPEGTAMSHVYRSKASLRERLSRPASAYEPARERTP
jgi:RNA polymerase sigma-70 factor, ECF subfamily